MSWRTAEPPINPPEVDLYECDECDGTGKWIDREGPWIVREQDCGRCEGRGEREYTDDENPYAPDTWKEAEGIA